MPFGRQSCACCSRDCREGPSTQGTDLPQKNNPLLGAAFTLLRLFKGVPAVLKSKNSESNVNRGHIHMAKELRGLELPAGISHDTGTRAVFTLTYLWQCYVFEVQRMLVASW